MSKKAQIRERQRRARRRRQLTILLITVGAALIITAILIVPSLRPMGQIVTPESPPRPMVDARAMGDPNAPVRIEEFSDFQCPFCARFHLQTLDQIAETYVATGKVYFVFRHYPFIGPESQDAALASMCAAEQNQFWEYADILFANQTGENVGAFERRRLDAFAEAIGLDMDQFNDCMRQKRYQEEVRQDYLAGLEAEVRSTPTFLINGELVLGALPFAEFQGIIEAKLAEAGAD